MKKILRYTLILIVFLVTCEVILRIAGNKTFPEILDNVEESIPSRYDGFDTVYGLCPVPGKFTVIINHKLKFKVTHNEDSSRATRRDEDSSFYAGKPRLNIYGCSFTWGAGISDSSTYPFLIQSAMPSCDVKNKGVFAAGNIQAFLQIREEIRRAEQPAIALVSYASFHDQRNTWTGNGLLWSGNSFIHRNRI